MEQKLKIMAAVDLSDYSPITVRYGVWLAKKMDGELLLVNVINQRDLDMVQRTMVGFESFSFSDYLTEQVQDREAEMKDLFKAVSPGTVKCRYLVQTGTPYLELLSAIESEKPSLMVVGTKGRSNLA
ncbi:MAG: universal stress protein, partial [Desulfosarcina sp.]|nr:universal stress protein [Desulfosarcina sp.]